MRSNAEHMKTHVISLALAALYFTAAAFAADFSDKQANADALPAVPAPFEVTLFAREPLVRQPCSMAFDARGRVSLARFRWRPRGP